MLLLAGNIEKAQLEKAQLKGRDIRAVRTGRQVASTVSGRHFPKKSTVVQRFNSCVRLNCEIYLQPAVVMATSYGYRDVGVNVVWL